MRNVIVSEWMTLDGVVQSPAYPDEDPDGGFGHGGWHVSYLDEAAMKWTTDNVVSAGGFLLGRRTYEIFAAHWPNATEQEQALAEPLNTKPKYVASRTLTEPLNWQNSSLLGGDAAEAVRALKRADGGDLLIVGSTELVQTLMQAGVVDRVRLMIDPILVGGGKRIFPDDRARKSLHLIDSQVTSTGAILATYASTSDG